MEYDNTNRGTSFPNDRKEKDTHADYKGSINVEGKEYWLNGWDKTSKNGVQFISWSVQPKEAKAGVLNKAKPAKEIDDLPF